MATEQDKEEILRLRSRSADYLAHAKPWMFYLLSYEGGPDYISSETIFKHMREHDEDYRDRLARAIYQNYCQPLVDFVPEFIYSQPIERKPPDTLSKAFEAFKKNVDRIGTTLDEFMRSATESARIFGHVWVLLDKPKIPEDLRGKVVSMQHAEEYGMDKPYVVLVSPLEVFDSVFDSTGLLVYIKRVQVFDELLGTGDRRTIERYTEWYTDHVQITDVDITKDEAGELASTQTMENVWGVIPWVQHFHKHSKRNKDTGISFLASIAFGNQRVANLTSLIDEFLYRQAFNLLMQEQNTAVPQKGSSSEGSIGTSNVLEYPKGAKEPAYLTPPAEPAEFIQSERAQTVQEMYRQASQDVINELFSKTSGDSKKQSFARAIPVIARQADKCQQTESRMFHLWAQMQGGSWAGGKIAYRDDYSVTNLMDLILQLTSIFRSLKVPSPTFWREEWLRIIREFDGRIDPETMRKIIDEIAAVDDEDILKLTSGPSDVKAGPNMPATANMLQGQMQETLATDRKIAMESGSAADTKEAVPDKNRRAKTGTASAAA